MATARAPLLQFMQHTNRTILASLMVLLASTRAGIAAADLNSTIRFDIAPQALHSAVVEYTEQSGVQITSAADLLKGQRSPGVVGEYPARIALTKLLQGTELAYDIVDANTVAIRLATVVQIPGGTPSGKLATVPADSQLRYPSVSTPTGTSNRQMAGSEGENEYFEEIVVTGTHIRGNEPVGSQLIVIGRDAISASGHGRIQDFLETLPQNFSGSASEDSFRDIGAANDTRGQAIDLRGLGASSTLVLVNGRRQPSGGLEGAFVDISSIAATAVDRIEILADGASALYGSDAIGGVVNFVLRKDYDGMETDARLGTNDGNAEEVTVSQLIGRNLTGGNVLFGYQYYHRDPLMAEDTPYASRNRDFSGLGGTDFRPFTLLGGNPGTLLNLDTFEGAFIIPPGQDGTNLSAADLIPGQGFTDLVKDNAVLSKQTFHSAFLNLSYPLTDRIEVTAESRYGRRKMQTPFGTHSAIVFVTADNPFYVDPFDAGLAVVAYDFQDDLGGPSTISSVTDTYTATAGLAVDLTAQWKLNASTSYGREDNKWRWLNITDPDRLQIALDDTDAATAFNVFGDGSNTNPATIEFVRSVQFGEGDFEIASATAIADGPLFRVPGGIARLAVGADYRDERLDAFLGEHAPSTGINTLFTSSVGKLDRQVKALFAELAIPIWGPAQSAGKEEPRLRLTLASRYEDYSDFGSTVDPKIGLEWRPAEALKFRGSWGTSFRAPRFNELSGTANAPGVIGRVNVPDPQSASGFANTLQIVGVDPNLREETADVWTVGFDLTRRAVAGLTLAATYFNIDYEGKIASGQPPTGARTILLFEDEWAEVITRDPSAEQVAELCNEPNFLGVCAPTVQAIIDTRLRNLGGLRVRGVDVEAGYRIPLQASVLALGLAGTYTLDYERANTSTAPFRDVLDIVGNPVALRLRASAGWSAGPWQAHAFVNYVDSYRDTLALRDVDSWTTVDTSVAYEFVQGSSLEGVSLQLSAVNLFDEAPPFVDQTAGFDFANATQTGRLLSLAATKRW